MFERLTVDSRNVLFGAQAAAKRTGCLKIGPPHLLIAIMARPSCGAAQYIAGLWPEYDRVISLAKTIEHFQLTYPFEPSAETGGHLPFNPGAKKILERALRLMLAAGEPTIDTKILFMALVEMAATDSDDGKVLRGFFETWLPVLLDPKAISLIREHAKPDPQPIAERVLLLTRALRELLLELMGDPPQPVSIDHLRAALLASQTTEKDQ